ncbi:hypothetical protein V8E36_006886, partial [Tilletia maclaganii]
MEDDTPWVHITVADGFDYRKDYIRQADENLGECVWDYARYAGLQPGDVILHNRTVPLNCYAPIQEQHVMNGDVLNVIINTARALPFRRPEFKAELLQFSPKDKDEVPYPKPTGPPTRDDEVDVWVYLHDEWPGFPVFVIQFRALKAWRLDEIRDGVERALGKNRGERQPLVFMDMDANDTLEESHTNGCVHINLKRPRNPPSNVVSIAGVDFVPGPGVAPTDPPEDQVLLAIELEGPFEGNHKPRLGVRVHEEVPVAELLDWIRSRLQLGTRRIYICHHFYVLKPEGILRDIGFANGSCFSLFVKYGAPPAAL